ncbi:MAG TPA: CoA transferase, partial [Galbitalea sp.]|nr:CoA transferase [Galbitalea sp.]
CGLIGIPEAQDDPRFDTGAHRSSNRDALGQLIESALSARPAAEWVPIITEASIPCGPIYRYSQAFGSPQVEALGLIRQSTRRDGSALPLLRGPLSIDGEPSDIYSRPPLLGEQSTEILREVGYADGDIDRLEADGVLKTNSEPV